MSNPNPDMSGLTPFTGADDPRRATGALKKGVQHSKTRLRRLLELTEQLTNPITKEVEGFSVIEQLDLAQIIKARKGDTRAYQAIMDRLEGKPQQTTDITSNGEQINPLLVQFIKDAKPDNENTNGV